MSKGKQMGIGKGQKTTQFSVSIDPALFEQLNTVVNRAFGNRSKMVSEFIRKGLKGAGK